MSSTPSTAHRERDRIRSLLVAARPALTQRLSTGPSGSLTLPVPGGRSVEIGRLPQNGRPEWVVVEPVPDGVRVHRPATLEECVAVGLAAVARTGSGSTRLHLAGSTIGSGGSLLAGACGGLP